MIILFVISCFRPLSFYNVVDAYGKDGQLARTLVQLNANPTEIAPDPENEVNPCLRVVSCHDVFTHRHQIEPCITCFLRAMPGLRDREITVRIFVRGSKCTPWVAPAYLQALEFSMRYVTSDTLWLTSTHKRRSIRQQCFVAWP